MHPHSEQSAKPHACISDLLCDPPRSRAHIISETLVRFLALCRVLGVLTAPIVAAGGDRVPMPGEDVLKYLGHAGTVPLKACRYLSAEAVKP
jgi:hypothetical protein